MVVHTNSAARNSPHDGPSVKGLVSGQGNFDRLGAGRDCVVCEPRAEDLRRHARDLVHVLELVAGRHSKHLTGIDKRHLIPATQTRTQETTTELSG